MSNLETARNISLGRGFTSGIVQQLAAPQVVPGPEVVRPPAIPYLLVALAPLGGDGPARAVVINILSILAAALLLRATMRTLGEPMLGDLAGLFVLVAHDGYTVLEAWNNDLLTALTAGLVFIDSRARAGRLSGLRLSVPSGAIVAVGFLTKQTFILGAIPLVLMLLAADSRRRIRLRARDCAAFLATSAVLTAPYVVRNFVLFGNPLYAPTNALRLPLRYDLPGYAWYNRVLLFGRHPLGYADIVERLGLARVLYRELYLDAVAIGNIVRISPLLVAVAVAVLILTVRRRRAQYAGGALLLIMPVFDGAYWMPEPRYVWPVTACLLATVGLAAATLRESRRSDAGPSAGRRFDVLSAVHVGLAAAAVFAAISGIRGWKNDFDQSIEPAPEWTSLLRSLPPNARIICASPYGPAWFGERAAIVAPLGDRPDLGAVLSQYHPDYYMELTSLDPAAGVAFRPEELQLIGKGTGWRLHRIRNSSIASAR